jgi:hypothetical protein
MTNILWVLALLFFSFNTFGKECSLKEIYGSCEKLKDGSFGSKKSDGTVMPNFYSYLTTPESPFISPEYRQQFLDFTSAPEDEKANDARLNRLLNFIKKVYIEEALAGRNEDDPNLDGGTKAIIARIKALGLKHSDEDCEKFGPLNANYNSNNHTVNVCHGMDKLPELSLLFLLAHEVSHAIDTCRISTDLVQIVPDVEFRECEDSNISKDKKPKGLAKYAGQIMAPDENEYSAFILVRCGFAKMISPRQSDLGKNNISKAIYCVLGASTKEGFTMDSFEQHVTKFKSQQKAANPRITEQQLAQLVKKNEKSLKETYEKYRQMMLEVNGLLIGCNMQPGKFDNAAERSSDILATKVVSKYIQGKTLNAEQKVSLVELQAQFACGYKLSKGKFFSGPFYPNGEERLNILLQDPNVQSALNCTYTGKKECSTDESSAATPSTSNEKGQK